MPLVGGLQCVIVVFPDHTHLLKHNANSPVENQNDLKLDFKVFFFVDSCC